jgi:hypothetical protein
MRRRASAQGNAARVAAALALALSVVVASAAGAGEGRPAVTVDPASASAPSIDPTDQQPAEAPCTGACRITPLVAPVPFKNTQVGWGLVLLVGAIHRFEPDTTIKPSTGAVGGFYTENHSWGLMAMEMARLRHDALRVRGLVSHFDVRYDFFGIGEDAGSAGLSVPLEQTMDFAVGSAVGRIAPAIYAGAALMWMQTTAELREPPPAGLAALNDLARTELLAPGIQGEYDTRNDDYWPTRGSVAKLKSWFISTGLGSSRDFQRYMGGWSLYTKLRSEQIVLATNLAAAAATGDAPFYMLPSIGAGLYALRGYTQGRYRDHVMTTAQAEARFHTPGRWGATAFFGFGQVAPSVADLSGAVVLPAGGLGLRYKLTREFPMHMRVDYAWGKNGNLVYFSVGEAF